MEAYASQHMCSLGRVDVKSAPFVAAIREAESLKPLTDSERLSTCKYIPDGLKQVTKLAKPAQQEEPLAKKRVPKPAQIAKPCAVDVMCDLSALNAMLSSSDFKLRDFIQTNFKIDSDGVLKLVTSPKDMRSKGETTSKRRPGRPKKKGERVVPKHVARQEGKNSRVSPTIPHYFGGTPENPRQRLSEHICKARDQQVPTADDDKFLSPEAQAMKEMQEIEGLLTTLQDSEPPKAKEQGTTRRMSEGANLEWMDSMLGEIDHIESMWGITIKIQVQ